MVHIYEKVCKTENNQFGIVEISDENPIIKGPCIITILAMPMFLKNINSFLRQVAKLVKFDDNDGYYCFHAGTKLDGDKIVTNGGRVLGITAKGADLKEARANAYAATEWIDFDNKYMRHDIGKAIDEA